MHSSIQYLFAAVTFALIAMVPPNQCAGRPQGGAFVPRQLDTRPSGSVESAEHSHGNRLGNDLLSDLRSNRRETNEHGRAAGAFQNPLHYEPTMLTGNLATTFPQTASSLPTAEHTRLFSDNDQPPPVVVVWLNSDLQSRLLSEAELKQWMNSMPEHDRQTAQGQINRGQVTGWQANPASRVDQASFGEPVAEPKGFAGATKKIEDFEKRLADITGRLDTKHKQIAAGEVGDQVNKSELNSVLSIVSEWVARAKSDLEKLKEENQKEVQFEANLERQQQLLVTEQMKEGSELPAFLRTLPRNRSRAIGALQSKVHEDEVILQSGTDELSKIREQIATRDQRVTELPRLLRENAKEEDKTKQLMEEFHGQTDDLNQALQKLRFEAKFLSLEITEKSLKLESRRKEQVGRMLPLQLEELTLRIRRMKVELAELRKRSDKLRDQQLDERRLAADNALNEKLTQSTPQLKELAEFNINLVSQKSSMAVKSDEFEKELINVRQLEKKLTDSQKRIEAQIKTLGPTASGIRLVEHRRSLISTGKSRNRLLELAERLQHKQARKLAVKERLDQLVLSDFFKLDVLAKVEEQVNDPVQRKMAVDVANQLMETEKEYATDLMGMFEDNIQKLSQLEAAHRTLIDAVDKARAFSDENALWVRSSKPIEISDLNRCQAGLQAIILSEQWQGLGDHAFATFKKRPYDVGLLALVIGSLLVVRRRLRWSHE